MSRPKGVMTLPKCELKGDASVTSTEDQTTPKLASIDPCLDHMPQLENLSPDASCPVQLS